MRVLIVDDHQLIREGVKRILHDSPEITIVGEAEDGQKAMDMLRKEKWDVVILDINLPAGADSMSCGTLNRSIPRFLCLS
jgi:two-component system, NarL family, invasion response regulator UvrY